MTQQLVLVSARKSRGGDQWTSDDYDVRLGDAKGKVVGRIVRLAPGAKRSSLVLDYYGIKPRRPTDRGYVASREEAMAEFKRYWDAGN